MCQGSQAAPPPSRRALPPLRPYYFEQCFIFHTKLLCNHYTLQAHPGQTHCVTLHTWRSLNCTQHCDSMQAGSTQFLLLGPSLLTIQVCRHHASPITRQLSLPTCSHNGSQLEQISMGGLQALATCSCCRPISPRLPVSGRNYTLGLAHAGGGRVMGCVALHTCGCACMRMSQVTV